MSRLLFHIDVNSAFLSWEATRRVGLGEEDIRVIPSAIGVDRVQRLVGMKMGKQIHDYANGIDDTLFWQLLRKPRDTVFLPPKKMLSPQSKPTRFSWP